jgi:hypothetical protein
LLDPSNAWTYIYGEVGDLCVGTSTYYDPTGLFAAQRIWSNTAAEGNGSPCIPLPSDNRVFVSESPPSPNGNQLIPVNPGSSVTLTVDGWSTAPATPWIVYLYQTSGGDNFGGAGPTVTVSPEYAELQNDGTVQFTVTMPANTPAGVGDYSVLTLYPYVGGVAQDTMTWPVIVYAP